MKRENMRLIISGGGTGGHIFPAIAIANAVKEKCPQAQILFVGANGRMEMEKVPAAGYEIKGLPIVGLQRKQIFKNIFFPIKLLVSLCKTRKIIKDFRPDVVVGVGGYASGPTLFMASLMKIPCLIQEQNSYAGLTNKLLSKRVDVICVDYDNMEQFFPAKKIKVTGNPIRQDLQNLDKKSAAAYSFFGFTSDKKVILAMGGSLGARTINESMEVCLDSLLDKGYQVLWQTGKSFYERAKAYTASKDGVVVLDFISTMDLAYAIAAVIISRAGALSVSELCMVGKPCILIPSPNVAEDHQTKNAMALSAQNAAILIKDEDAKDSLYGVLDLLLDNEHKQALMAANIKKMARPGASVDIANEIIKLVK